MLMKTPAEISENGKILVVDDEKVILDIMSDFLGSEGYQVVTASNAKQALQRLEEGEFDLVLTDLKMPGMSGMELLEEIKSRYMRPYVIVMTGYGTVESAVECIKKGAFDYLQKPFKMKEVESVVARALKQYRLEEENIQLKEITNLYRVSEAMNSTLSLPEILDTILDTVIHELDADAVTIHELEGEGNWNLMAFRASPGMKEYENSKIVGEIDGDEIINNLNDNSYLLSPAEEAEKYFRRMPEVKEFYYFMSVPMRIKSRVTGLVSAYSFNPHRKFLKGYTTLLGILAGRAGMAIENARLYEQLKRVFQETIQSLAIALEAKDPYTSGHTKRVTEYAVLIAKGMGLPQEDVERITRAALLHDIGKIGVKLHSLKKKGGLSAEEYEMFKQHTIQGRLILEPIKFMADIIPMVELHHERYDGTGYPYGLSGEDIPLGARILNVADSFDAMTSDRPYRRSLSRRNAFEELRRNAGTQFDPEIVEVFIRELKKAG